jgi:hypothetical protein
MASLIMTIDSDSEVDVKKSKKKVLQKEVVEADIIMEPEGDTQMFKEQDDDSDDSDYLKRDDGGHGNAWGFSKYLPATETT